MGFPWAIVAAIASIFATGASYVQATKAAKAAKRASDQNKQKGLLVNKESNVEPIPVIYGTRRVGGTRVYVSSDGREIVSGDPDYDALTVQYYGGEYDPDGDLYDFVSTSPTNKYLYIALVLCEGEVESISDILLDDLPISDPKWGGKATYEIRTGSDDQAASTILRQSSDKWTSTHRLRGVAYVALRFEYDPEIFDGIPEITAVVAGRKVYDPRDVGQSEIDPGTWTFSNNPALCLRDYLTNSRFGKGLASAVIDNDSFIEAANDCDSSVTLYDGGGSGKLFECNIVLDTGASIFDNVNKLLIGCRGFLPYSQGTYQLRIDKSRSPVMEFDVNNIIDGITIRGEGKSDKYNRITVKFANPENNWQDDVAIWPPEGSAEESQYLSEDGGFAMHDEIELEGITNYYQARDLARIFLLRSRNALRSGFQCTSDALQLSVADIITVTHATPGWASKPFQVDEIAINTDGTCTVSLLEYDSTIYTWEVGTVQQSYPDTYLPNPYLVGVISDLSAFETAEVNSDGSVMSNVDVTWTPPIDSNVISYELQGKRSGNPDSSYRSFSTAINSYQFSNLRSPFTYDLRVRCVNQIGVKGDWVSASFNIDGKTDDPNAVFGILIVAGINNIKVSWTAPADKDLDLFTVYRNTSNNFGTSSPVGSVYGSTFTDNNILDGVTYYYWVVATDTTGNLSVQSGAGSGVATSVADGIVDGSIDVAKFAAGIEPVSLVTSVPGSKTTEVVYNTTSSKLYRWSGASYITAIPTSDLTGTITETQITDGAISSPKIAADAVTSAKIQAGAVTADKILANSITAGQIAAGAITATEIAADAVAIGKLVSDTFKIWDTNYAFEMGTNTTVAGYTGSAIFRSSASSSFGVGGLGNASANIAVAGQQAFNASTSYGGVFLNSTVLGGASHRSYALLANNTRAASLGNASFAVDIASSTYGINSFGNVNVTGNITATGTITPFTGAHDALIDELASPEAGDIICDVLVVIRRDVSNALTNVAVSSLPCAKSAVGVYVCDAESSYIPVAARKDSIRDNPDSEMVTEMSEDYASLFFGKRIIFINSVGEGLVNVCGESGDIAIGDLIVTSSVPGKGMRQTDDIIRSYTVAKSRESVTFNNTSEIKQIACIYLCG